MEEMRDLMLVLFARCLLETYMSCAFIHGWHLLFIVPGHNKTFMMVCRLRLRKRTPTVAPTKAAGAILALGTHNAVICALDIGMDPRRCWCVCAPTLTSSPSHRRARPPLGCPMEPVCRVASI